MEPKYKTELMTTLTITAYILNNSLDLIQRLVLSFINYREMENRISKEQTNTGLKYMCICNLKKTFITLCRPREMSSKKPVSRFRQVIDIKKKVRIYKLIWCLDG